MPFFLNSEFIWNIVPVGSSNYRPSAPFLYEEASHVKTAISAIIIIITIIIVIVDGVLVWNVVCLISIMISIQ